jgi:hypothetical protein
MGLDRSLDDEGISDLEGPLPEKVATGDPQEGVSPPADKPSSEEWGMTAEEQRAGESLDDKIGRERPDVFDDPARLSRVEEAIGGSSGLRLVDSGDEDVDLVDDEKDAVARAADDEDGLSAEEAAVHTRSVVE